MNFSSEREINEVAAKNPKRHPKETGWATLEADPALLQWKFATGEVDLDNFSAYIQSKETIFDQNVQSEEVSQVLKNILQNEQATEILKLHTGTENDILTEENLRKLLEMYPDPQDFIKENSVLLEHIEKENIYSLVQFESALKYIVATLYGERATTLDNLFKQKIEGFNNYAKANAERVMSKARILKKIDPTEQITLEDLDKLGLGPVASVAEKGVIFHMSPVFSVAGQKERSVAIVYVEKDEEINICPFYSSNSHGIWKLLPAMGKDIKTEKGPVDRYFSKGFSEESVSAPLSLQKYLTVQKESISLDSGTYDRVLFGTSALMTTKDVAFSLLVGHVEESPEEEKYISALKENPEVKSHLYFDETESDPILDIKDGGIEPENFVIPEEFQPDFSSGPVSSWEGYSKTYGTITYEVFSDKGGSLNYIFCSVEDDGSIWLSAIDPNSSISKAGVRKNWIKANKLITPVMEQDKNGDYVDVSDYVERIAVVAQYHDYKQKIYREFMDEQLKILSA